MPKTKEVVACVDHKNHRTEYQKLTNIMVDDERTFGDVLKEHDIKSDLLDKLNVAFNNNADVLDSVIDVMRMLIKLLEGVLTEDDLNALKEILEKKGKEE